jgi:hypothetical protein
MNYTKTTTFVFLLFCCVSIYSYGTAMMDYFLVYPSRFLVGEEEFVAYHALLEKAIWPISVAPFLLAIVLNAWLVWRSPRGISRKLLTVSLVLLLLDFLSTVIFQAPWNYELARGKNIALMEKITASNWARVFLESAQVVMVLLLLNKSMHQGK